MEKQQMSTTRPIVRYEAGQRKETEDRIVLEEPLTLHINGEEFATMVCTPVDLEEMVLGFLASEGVIRFRRDVASLEIDADGGFAHIELAEGRVLPQQEYTKRVIGSCCGKSRQFYFQQDVRTAKTSTSRLTLTAGQCMGFMREMQDASHVFQGTGGVHNAALFDASGMIAVRTDIGRHNALDKLYGYCLNEQITVRDKVLVFSGRISSEVLTKAAKIGVGIVLSKSAPTALAIDLADDLNITAVGFIRGDSLNVYSHPERITEEKEGAAMSCPIDHTVEDTKKKLEEQKPHLPKGVYTSSGHFLDGEPTQEELNDLFHLLKKYDLAERGEQEQREARILELTGGLSEQR
ncbi:Sulfur carrier protein FdhD [Alkalicoccus chagannorensis]